MQDTITLHARAPHEPFDVPTIKERLLCHEACIQDPVREDWILVVNGEEAQRSVRRTRQENERNSFPAGVVEVQPQRVGFTLSGVNKTTLGIMRDLAQWILDSYDPQVLGDRASDDWTDRCNGRIDPLFEPVLPPREP